MNDNEQMHSAAHNATFHQTGKERQLASAYKDVLKRRNSLDIILRNAAETDALTNLPNRYSYEQYMLESAEDKTSLAVFLFDVNYLKKTNNTLGHPAGDKMICAAAECISTFFGDKCFRFGGDEFAAIVENCTPESINQMVMAFRQTEIHPQSNGGFFINQFFLWNSHYYINEITICNN